MQRLDTWDALVGVGVVLLAIGLCLWLGLGVSLTAAGVVLILFGLKGAWGTERAALAKRPEKED